ncbi:MAG: 4Fe-4S binding protein [Chloroflexi bacterium]|nr:4Fe-4S binding protein [Chloroflexota bacterium]
MTSAKMPIELTRNPIVKAALRNRWPQFVIRVIALAGFVVAILSGFVGTPVGNHNFGIVFVWIVWWALLMLIAVPLAGRSWCAVCPIPMPGEWLQNGALLKPRGKGFGLNRKWPRRFRNIWLQNIAFTLLALFSAVVLTQPSVTGVVLLIFLIVALITSVIFERRAFCRYLCPVGGFIGLYSQAAPVEVRVKDPAVCADGTSDGLPVALSRKVRMVVGGLVLAFLGAVTVLGFQFAVFVWNQETPVLNISLGIPSLAIPIGALLFAVHLVFMFRNYAERRYVPGYVLEDLSGEKI